MKKFGVWILKAIAGGVIALLALNAFSMLYYNVPVHYTNPDGSTEYKWESSTFYSKGTEGFAWGVTNNDGFNNLRDYTPGEKIDILLMGSSHMEGFNVAQDENAGAVLNTLFDGEKYTYNIGTAGHTMLYCIKHLAAALDTYEPGGYVVIETNTVDFAPEDIDAVLSGTLADIPSQSGALITLMQKLPYLRLLYTVQFKGLTGDADAADTEPAETPSTPREPAAALSPLLERVADICSARGVQPIIVFDPAVYVDGQGEACTVTDADCLAAFESVCAEHGIVFIDLTDAYTGEYAESCQLPYGFVNTTPGEGHMNKVGHRLFAQEVWETIKALEEEQDGI